MRRRIKRPIGVPLSHVDIPPARGTLRLFNWRGSQVVRPRSAKPLFTGSIPVPASTLFPFSLGCVSHETHQKALKGARKRLLTLKFNFICRWSRRMLATYGET